MPRPSQRSPLGSRVPSGGRHNPEVGIVGTSYQREALAEPHQVRVVDGAEILACHHRSYGKGEQIDDDAHVEALVAEKRAALGDALSLDR